MFLVLMPVMVPFFQSTGIGMKGVYLLQSVFAITVFTCEVPSGYISDLLGRKKTLVISALLKGIGFSLFPLADGLNLLIVAEVILGVAVSLNSGTDTALIYDTMEVSAPKQAQIKVLGKSLYYFSLGEGFASLIASLLLILTFSIKELAIISAFVAWIPFFISLSLVEPPRNKMTNTHRENFKYIFSNLFEQSRLLNLIILNSITTFSGTLYAVWLFQKYWTDLKIPLIYFGFLWALTNFTVSLVSRNAHKLEKQLGSAAIVTIIGLLPIVGYLGISLVDHLFGVMFCLLFQVCRGLSQVIFKDALNKRVTGDFRATANSITQMGVRIFFSLSGPLFGWLIDSKNLSYATLCMTGFYILVFLFFVLPLLRERGNYDAFESN